VQRQEAPGRAMTRPRMTPIMALVGVSSREPAYPIFMSQRSRARRGAYVLALAIALVALIVLRLV
jgi:hypothetical protein